MSEAQVAPAEPVVATATPDRSDRTGSWIRWAGLGFAVLFLVGWTMTTFTWDDTATDQEIVDWYGESGNRIRQIAGAYLTVLAGIAFVMFTTTLARFMPRGVAQTFRALALMFSALLIAGATAIANASASVVFPGMEEPQNAEVLWLLEGVGFGMVLLGGTITVGIAMILASYGMRETGAIPSWLVVGGYLAGGALVLVGTLYIPLVLVVVWSLAVALTVREPADARGVTA